MKTYIIGCGGVGSWLAASLAKLIGPQHLVLVDGDTLETKNLDRQLFSESEVGRNKAEALASRFNCAHVPEYYSEAMEQHLQSDWLFVCVDNHPGRNSALNACDMCGCHAICGANETYSAEAFIYHPRWRRTKRDPRVYYPEIAESRANDPRGAVAGCTGEAQVQTPQLVSANFMAASLMQHIYVAYAIAGKEVTDEVRETLPHRLSATVSRLESIKL